ncbi:MAG: Gfo/Idh/MocA family oxidoreductase [Kiritimatiellae bacterium]|nr:Gfo/Idh/MocA family oxidoreductase [Kiritimatiellia bacterium]
MKKNDFSRRQFLAAAASTVFAVPSIVPARVLGAEAPSKRFAVGIIGCGRIACGMDAPGLFANRDIATLVAISDVDTSRMDGFYQKVQKDWKGRDLARTRCYQDYRKLLDDPAIDAVMICTPDFWHARMAVEACLKGKDVYVQKPMAMSVEQGRAVATAVKACGRVFHLGTQLRSEGIGALGAHHRQATEYVWDGRIGKVVRVEIGLPNDPAEFKWPVEEPVPACLDWNLWQGPCAEKPYSRLRSFPRGTKKNPNAYVLSPRPGWLTVQEYCMGMIAGHGSHDLDLAQWALGEQLSGPNRVKGTCTYPKRRLWDVHGPCDITLTYDHDNGVHAAGCVVHVQNVPAVPHGIRYIGEKGDWIYCAHGNGTVKVTTSDPSFGATGGKGRRLKSLDASRPELVTGPVKKQAVRNTLSHHRAWFEAMKTRGETNVPVEVAHRSTTACVLSYWAMKLGRELIWDPKTEHFVNDAEAERTLSRPERGDYGIRPLLKDLAARA